MDDGECRIWIGAVTSIPFIQFKLNGKNYRKPAIWVAYILSHGPIPEGNKVSNTCGNSLCIRPSHLTLRPIAGGDQSLMNILLENRGVFSSARKPHQPKDPITWFERNLVKHNDCWIWNGHLSSGYPYFTVNKRLLSGRKFSIDNYTQHNGHGARPMTPSCGNALCVAPDHQVCRICEKQKRVVEAAIPKPRKTKTPEEIADSLRVQRRTCKHRKRAKEHGLPPGHTTKQWRELVESQNSICNHCHRKTKMTRDHIVAYVNGGTNEISNIQGLCHPCNTAKGDVDWKIFDKTCSHRDCGVRFGMPAEADPLPGLVA